MNRRTEKVNYSPGHVEDQDTVRANVVPCQPVATHGAAMSESEDRAR